MKRWVQKLIRVLHVTALNSGLPQRTALYFHNLPNSDYVPFEELIRFFHEEGYTVVGPDDFIQATGHKSLYLSFDDNYRTWLTALPLFDRLGVRATFYVNSLPFRDMADETAIMSYYDRLRYNGERVPLSTTELKEIAQAGHTIGAHGHSHFDLADLPVEEAREEILLSKQILEEIIGGSVCHFSYPFGMPRHFNDELREYCRQVGFRTVANATPGLQHAPQAPLNINRHEWGLEHPLRFNLRNLGVDGRLFLRLTGRSPVG